MPAGKLARSSIVMKSLLMKICQFTLRQAPAARALSLACLGAFAAFNASAVHAQTTATDLVQLPTVMVTANRMEQALQTAPIGATVLLGDDIRASGVLDANEAVRKLGGVAARTDLNGGREFSLDLRGYGETAGSNLVVVVDGIRITQIDLASARLSSIAPEMIERIEIIRGGASVMWGEGAAGGVISVTTKSGATKGLSGSVSLGVESFNGRDAQARVDLVGDTASFNVNARQYRTDGYRDNSANEQTTYSLGGAVNLGAFKARLGYSNDVQDSRFPGYLSFADFAANPTSTQTPNDYGRIDESKSTANFSYKMSNWQAFLDIGQRNRKTSSQFYGDNSSISQSTQFSPRIVNDIQLGGSLITTVLGYDNNRATANNLVNSEVAEQQSTAWYGNSDVLLDSQTRLSIGARTEVFNKNGMSPANATSYSFKDNLDAWNVAINQTVVTGLDLYGRAAKSYRLPNIDENRSPAGKPPQVQIRPTISKDIEFGVKWAQEKSSATARVFRQTSIDEIAYVRPYNVNQDAIKRTGIELEGSSQLTRQWSVGGNLQKIDAQFSNGVNVGKRVPHVSDLTLSARIAYAFDLRNRLEFSAQHRSSAFPSGDNANTCSTKVPSTTYFNARYNFNAVLAGKGWSFVAEVNNLTNKSSYSFNYDCSYVGALYPDAGRTFSLRAKYAF
jgi:iron complex outermembrane recepter protein